MRLLVQLLIQDDIILLPDDSATTHISATIHKPERATHVQARFCNNTHTLARNPRAGAETHKHTQPHTQHRPQCTPSRHQPIKTDERHDSTTTHTPERATHVQQPKHTNIRNHTHDTDHNALPHDPSPSKPTNRMIPPPHTP